MRGEDEVPEEPASAVVLLGYSQTRIQVDQAVATLNCRAVRSAVLGRSGLHAEVRLGRRSRASLALHPGVWHTSDEVCANSCNRLA